MTRTSAVIAGVAVAALFAATAARAQTVAATARPGEVPMYTNARVVSINALDRTFVVRQADGVQQTVELDHTVAGFGDVRVGDEVILALRGEPGRPRASSILRSVTSPPRRTEAPGPLAPLPGGSPQAAAEAFTRQVADLATEAARVDRLWSAFRTTCNASVGGGYEGAREWFSLWANDVRADLSNGYCRDLYNQIVGLGETVMRGMARAEDAARRSLAPGDIRDARQRYSMDWDGWSRPAPGRQPL
jgi:hypothetical protein